jgi:hypothetical protein
LYDCECRSQRVAGYAIRGLSDLPLCSGPIAGRDLIRWRVSLITATPAKFIDFPMAPDAETAEEQVAEAHDISDDLRPRLIAIREDL